MPNFDDIPRPLESAETMQSTPRTNPCKRSGQVAYRASAREQVAGMFAILVLVCLGLTACGGSSGGSSNTAATAGATTSANGAGSGTASTGSSPQRSASGALRGRFAAVRECLQKSGVTLPKRTAGSGGGFLGAGGAPVPPKGMTRAQFQATLTKCSGGNFGRTGGPGFRRVNSPVFTAALTKYAACLRQNGINIPAPNTSGKGPIFSTKGIDTSSPKFRQATMKCRASLISAFRRPQGAGTAGAGPQGGTTKSPEASR